MKVREVYENLFKNLINKKKYNLKVDRKFRANFF